MWVNSFVKQSAFSFQLLTNGNPKTLENADWYPIIHGISKFSLVLILAALLYTQMKYISELFNSKAAFLYGILISIEPYMIGINRWFHLSSLEIFFAFTSVLALLMYHKHKKSHFLIKSSLLLALSILSKFTTVMIIPVFAFVLLSKSLGQNNLKNKTIEFIKTFSMFLFFTFLFIFLMWPALWVNASGVFSKMYSSMLGSVSGDLRESNFTGGAGFVYYPLVLLFKLSPLTLILSPIALFYLSKRKNVYNRTLLLLTLFYYFGLTLTGQKIDRYSLVFFPIFLLAISVFLSEHPKFLKTYVFGALGIFLYAIIIYHPVYSAFYSPHFGGEKQALYMGVYDNSGEYFAQAASYLNAKGRNNYAYIPNNIESFSYYYKGSIQREKDVETNYVVVSLDEDRKYFNDYGCQNLEKSLGPKNGFVSVQIYSCN